MKIIIACGGGFSSSHLVTHLNKEAKTLGLDVTFEFLHSVKKSDVKKYDVVMCCPHLKYTLPKLIDTYELHYVPVYVIPPKMYGIIHADVLLTDALSIKEQFASSRINPFYFPGEENIMRVKRTRPYLKTTRTEKE